MSEKKLDLFGGALSKAPEGQKRVLFDNDGRKVVLVGKTEGKKCKECDHFYRDQRAKVYRRCELYPKKSWKANWEACGSFKPTKKREGIEGEG